jgi:serine/threonine protein kinase/tetratricopeptide (TPR) repeat protein
MYGRFDATSVLKIGLPTMTDGCLGTELLVDFLEGRLDAAARAQLEDHASRCEPCRELLSSLARDGTPAPGDALPLRGRALAPGTRIGRYVVDRELGAGGMGVVYAAHDPELERVVAIKLLRGGGDPRLGDRLRREAQAMAQLAHPNVVAVYDAGAFDDRVFIAMEYVGGETLARWLTAPRRAREILEVFGAAGAGLAAAHAVGIVHRDFKPENVLIGKDGRVRVGDFGLARAAGERSAAGEPGEPEPTSASPSPAGEPGEPAANGASPSPADEPARLAPTARAPRRPAGALAAAADPTAPTSALAGAADPTAPIGALASSAARADRDRAVDDLTRPGMLLGTPGYMAPEVHRGGDADARSDQFSFCVALYTALCGERPFAGDTLDALVANVQAGRLREPRVRLPRRVRAALARGLSVDPAARFASLDGLLAQLAPPRRRGRVTVALAAALAASVWLIARVPAASPAPCEGGAAAFAAAWSPARRIKLDAAFAATRMPYADAARRRVTAAFDRYATQWVDAYQDACRATRVHGEQTEAMLDLRMICLERRRQEAAALVATLGAADAEQVARAVTAAAGLVDVAGCADRAALQQVVAPPADVAARARLAGLAPRLAEVRARYEVGAFAQALPLARQVSADAKALGYLPFTAEAELMESAVDLAVGDPAAAEAALTDALWAAEAGRHDEVAARAWSRLVRVVGYSKGEHERALTYVPRATAAIARLGGSAAIEIDLELGLGALEYGRRRLADAAAHEDKARALAERTFGPGHLAVGKAVMGLGTTVMEQGDSARGIALLERARQIFEDALGPSHPWVGLALHNLGGAHLASRQLDAAERELRRALAIREATIGPRHRDVVATLCALGATLRREGRLADSLVYNRRAYALAEQVFGPDDLEQIEPRFYLATDLGQLGQLDASDALFARVEALATRRLGADHVFTAAAIGARGELLMKRGRWREAAARYERAIPILAAAQGTGDDLASARAGLGAAYLELGQPARALAVLEQIALDAPPPDVRGQAELALARAVWDSGGDRARARGFAQRARADLAASPASRPEDVAQTERWLASH